MKIFWNKLRKSPCLQPKILWKTKIFTTRPPRSFDFSSAKTRSALFFYIVLNCSFTPRLASTTGIIIYKHKVYRPAIVCLTVTRFWKMAKYRVPTQHASEAFVLFFFFLDLGANDDYGPSILFRSHRVNFLSTGAAFILLFGKNWCVKEPFFSNRCAVLESINNHRGRNGD